MRSIEGYIKQYAPAIAGVESESVFDGACSRLKCVELFAGCGGMAKGLESAGFLHLVMAEFNAAACATLHANYQGTHGSDVPHVLEADVRTIDWSSYHGVDLVAGGPPCQPFSNGGRAAGPKDVRDMWPEAIRAVREMQPRAFLFENVKGLLRPAFSRYLAHIVRSLEQGGSEDLRDSPRYHVTITKVNAADYGSPQKRERVLIAGVRVDCGTLSPFPVKTHSEDRLLRDKWTTGEYWLRHDLHRPDDDAIPRILRAKLLEFATSAQLTEAAPWLTCRDAFHGLGVPSFEATVSGHEPRGTGKQYKGHSGSLIDEPAKTLKAGVHGVPGGENMVVDLDGTSRHFTVREAARLQGLPDSFEIPGSWSQAMRQLGNAVPVQLAAVAGSWIASALG
ncbi:DNA (cytosine-5)-methyltransferase 1 [Paraburkholderia sp. BL6669N2]|uniref:DNA cytosine methyltransferase n=1 Tax=Paraburkholderia sp. BL6669N2 TaxID=1938807 RepID=UPI000E252D9F|nr:DNA (cytosine-5-)-methyltransferase [Paraburkholderia sp. BL6669N2]REG52101.1 DNA (cytosine-5)-methyltransferase 1 [Paraburkholderia sp. BL6669N2]